MDKRVHGTGKLQKVSSAHIGQSWAGPCRGPKPRLPFLVFLHPRCSFPDVAQCRNAGAAILVFDVPYVRQFIALVSLVRELAQALLHPPSQGL